MRDKYYLEAAEYNANSKSINCKDKERGKKENTQKQTYKQKHSIFILTEQ